MSSSGAAINYEAYELYKKMRFLIEGFKRKNMGMEPKYLFLSNDAFILLADMGLYWEVKQDYKTFMGIEIAPVGVPGIYAAIGEHF